MKILVTGANGMVAKAVCEKARALKIDVVAYEREKLDIADLESVRNRLRQDRPDSVINCAAWTDVDGCETNAEKAFAANARGPENLAKACREIEASLVTISTDYVFEGARRQFYTQRENPNPQSVYGKSKLDGERLAAAAHARTMVVRTGWIFGAGGKNFLSRIIELAKKGDKLKAIVDAYGTPTYAPDLAGQLIELARLDLPGIYHIVNAGEGASFAEFSKEALRAAGIAESLLEPVQFASLKRPAPRPIDSRLRCLISEKVGLKPLPHWLDAVQRFAR